MHSFRRGYFGQGAGTVGRVRSLLGGVCGLCVALCAVVVCALGVCLSCGAAVASAAEGCPNEAIRKQQGSSELPDCRAYELVTPAENDSDEPFAVVIGLIESRLSSPPGMQASRSGDRIAWTSQYTSPQSAGLDYLSTRGPDGWSTEGVIPPQSVENGLNCPGLVQIAAYSAELTSSVLADGFGQPGSGFESEGLDCGHAEPALKEADGAAIEEPQGVQNLFLRDNEDVSYQLIDVTPSGTHGGTSIHQAFFQAGSSDLSHVAFEEGAALVPGAGSGDELYDYFDGAVHLVTYLPGGVAVHGVLAGSTRNEGFEPYNLANSRHAMSADGSRVFFEAEGALYARTNPEQPVAEESCTNPAKTCTVQIDERQGGSESGGGRFMVASEDGSRVFFTDASRLTSDSHAEAGKPDLYEYDFEAPEGERLTDLTAGAGVAGEVLGVSGAAENGEEVYFVADTALTGAQKNSSEAIAQAGQPNLYLARGGALTFIATLDPSADECDWNTACRNTGGEHGINTPAGLTARTSGNGAYVVFESDLELTGYHNDGLACVPVQKGGPNVERYSPGRCEEIYRYSQSDDRLECVSCDPGGAPPVGPAVIRYASDSPNAEMRNAYPQRYVSESGQVFFESKDPLVPAATNGQYNVYEYENGEPRLISSGTSEAASYFLDATPDGSNVFFAAAKELVKGGSNAIYAIYDAREGGGFAEESQPATPCDGEECRGAAAPSPVFSTPATVNVAEAPAPRPTTTEAKKNAVKKTKPKKKKKKRRKPHGSHAKHRNVTKKTSRGGK